MALSKLKYNSLNVTPAASKAVGFDSGADDLSASLSGGSMVFIKKLTASSSATLSFVDGASSVVLDDTYKEYLFTFNNIHPQTSEENFTFNGSVDSGSNYNVTKTTTAIQTYLSEAHGDAELAYSTTRDLAQSTADQILGYSIGNDNDQGCSGYLHLFNPSSTTFVKHFTATLNVCHHQPATMSWHYAGYFNTTSAIDAVQFKMSSGNVDTGDICLYGIS